MVKKDESTATLGKQINLLLDEIKPYWRNPRQATEEAVSALARSIEEYGFQQPLVVDQEHVIIVGHTRYSAARRLGLTEVPTIIADLSPDKARQYRMVDNRAAEYTSWNYDTLGEELAELEGDLITSLFSEFADDDPTEHFEEAPEPTTSLADLTEGVEFVCPGCFHQWEADVTPDHILNGRVPADAAKESK